MSRARSVLLLACLFLVPTTSSAAGIPIRGRVLDSGGAALAKVRVRLVPVVSNHAAGLLELEGKDEPEAVASVESGSDGFFQLEAPETGMWKVIAGEAGDGLVPQEMQAAPLTAELDLPAVRLQRDAGLAVRVLGPDGRPVPGARVRIETAARVSSAWRNTPRSAVTDAEGRADLPRAGSAAVNVRAGASGYVDAERKEVRAKTVDLRLAAGSPLPLRVLGADGKPVAGVLVRRDGGGPLGVTGDGGLVELVAPGGASVDLVLSAVDGRHLEASAKPFQASEPRTPRELRLPAAGEITARVVSAAHGRPLPGALVWAALDFGGFRRTDARGEVRLPAPPGGTFAVQAAAAGFAAETVEIRISEKAPRRDIAFSLKPDLALAGIVVDEAGAPVAGVEITPWARERPQSLPIFAMMRLFQSRDNLVRSGADGRFRLGGLIAGVGYELRATKAGFATARVAAAAPVPDRPSGPLRIVLGRGRSAFGRVLGPDRRPVAGAQVTVQTSMAADPRARFRRLLEPESLDTFEAATGADGRFDLRNLPVGRYDLTARGRGWAPLTVANLEIPEGESATDLGTLVLAPGVALEGSVVDAAGRPVEGAEIRLTEASEETPFRRSGEDGEPAGLSGPDGFFRIEDLRAGSTVDVSAARTGYAAGAVQGIQVPPDQPVRIALQAVGSVSGRVVDPDGRPIERATVRVDIRPRAGRGFLHYSGAPLADRSDAEGNFRIPDVAPGSVGLIANAAGWQTGTVADLELRAGEEKSGIEIVLSRAATVEGRVLAPSGRALPGAEVRLAFEEGRRGAFAMANTDGEGRYVLDGLAPGHRTLEAAHPDHGVARKQVELRVGENSLDITLEGGSEVAGRVIDDSGAPVAGARVSLSRLEAFQILQANSESDGSFRFATVPDGSYMARAEKEGFAPAERITVNVSGGTEAIEIRLTRGGAIAGRIVGVESSELSRVRVQAQGRGMAGGRVAPDRSYRIENVREGEWRVRAELPGTGLYAEGVVRLEPGASEARLDLEMERGLELSGRVRRNGAPVPGEPLFLEGPHRSIAETDADGRFRFQGLSAGSYQLRLGDRSGGARHEETVDLQADREITIDLPSSDVTGRVVDAADGSPVAHVTVELLPVDGEAARGQAQSDSRGVFVLRGVEEGSWRLRAQADGYAPAEAGVRVDRSGPSDEVELSLRATEGVTLQVAMASGVPPRTLVYTVLDGAGRKVGNGSASVGEDGRARLSRVPAGSWQVLLLTGSSGAVEIAVTSPGDAGRLTLPPECDLRVKVPALADSPVMATVSLIGAGGRPFRAFSRFGEPVTAWDLTRGSVSLSDVPPGTWDVRVTAADGRTWRTTVTTAPGVEAEAAME